MTAESITFQIESEPNEMWLELTRTGRRARLRLLSSVEGAVWTSEFDLLEWTAKIGTRKPDHMQTHPGLWVSSWGWEDLFPDGLVLIPPVMDEVVKQLEREAVFAERGW